jgi:hypothetical protein
MILKSYRDCIYSLTKVVVMKSLIEPLVVFLFLAALTLPSIVEAQTSSRALGSISTPDRLPSSLGTLDFKDGAPSKETIAKVYDNLDLMHGVEAFVNAYQGASTSAILKGMNEAGIPNNEAVIFSELMDSKSLFLTANARPSEGWYYYPDSAWTNMLFQGGYDFETPPPEVSADGTITVNPPTGARTLNARTAMFYYATGITPAMFMRLTGIGAS